MNTFKIFMKATALKRRNPESGIKGQYLIFKIAL